MKKTGRKKVFNISSDITMSIKVLANLIAKRFKKLIYDTKVSIVFPTIDKPLLNKTFTKNSDLAVKHKLLNHITLNDNNDGLLRDCKKWF